MTQLTDITDTIEAFLVDWDRRGWMEFHGEWASATADHIAEGVIDPDGVEGTAVDLNVGRRSDGWDCTEGWDAHRYGDALYIHWWRSARGARHDRSLWVLVDAGFFGDDEDEE
jgi:hypothetical protein